MLTPAPPVRIFRQECAEEIEKQGKDEYLKKVSLDWLHATTPYKYSYHFTWLGRPIIQFPTDIIAMQEIVWRVKPTVIVETGIAHGGSTIFYASMIELLKNNGRVISVDIDIRKHNRVEIERHPFFNHITMIEGSSIDEEIVAQIKSQIKPNDVVLVELDSCHTHEHVLRELELYSPLVTKGSYLIVMDTIVNVMEGSPQGERPWNKKNNPMTALNEWLKTEQASRFEVDRSIDDKLLISCAPNGYLRCVR